MNNSHHSHRLLVVTQSIDESNPVLGFFTGWVKELAKKFEQVTVICLEEGKRSLPENVRVYSLGKEKYLHHSHFIRRLASLFKFYYLIWKMRRNYDSVFVHMNQEYVMLGWKFWKLFNKKIYLWRNHPQGNFFTNIAVWVSNKVFCTSPSAYVAKFKKTLVMPVGINTNLFKLRAKSLGLREKRNRILFLGRMDKIKRPDLLVEALNILDKKRVDFVCDFYGDPTPDTGDYYESLKRGVEKSVLKSKINFYKAVTNHETPKIYNEHDIYVNLTPSGSFDKTILEAAACGCLLVITNNSLSGEIDERMIARETSVDIAERIIFWLNINYKERIKATNMLRKYVLETHSLGPLINGIGQVINQ